MKDRIHIILHLTVLSNLHSLTKDDDSGSLVPEIV
jgi:hypothetical protein